MTFSSILRCLEISMHLRKPPEKVTGVPFTSYWSTLSLLSHVHDDDSDLRFRRFSRNYEQCERDFALSRLSTYHGFVGLAFGLNIEWNVLGLGWIGGGCRCGSSWFFPWICRCHRPFVVIQASHGFWKAHFGFQIPGLSQWIPDSPL